MANRASAEGTSPPDLFWLNQPLRPALPAGRRARHPLL